MMLGEALKNMKTVALGGHVRPDGDCIGSSLGLYNYIKRWYKDIQVDIYLEPISDVFRFLNQAEDIRHEIVEKETYDLFVSLDCGDVSRLGFASPLFESAKRTMCIDHHISNASFAERNCIVPEASSTSELVYNLLEKDKITKEIAECLYVGIVHDTGVFQYSSTSPETMEAAANLMRTGLNASQIIDMTYYEKTYLQNQILGRTLLESILLMDGRCIAGMVTKSEMDFYNVGPKDLEGIVSQLRVTKGVDVAIFIYELQPQEFKVSLRSNDHVDVSVIAQYFNGGGHKKAAGFTMKGTVHDVLNNVVRLIEKQIS